MSTTYSALAAYARLSSNPDGTLTSVPDQFAIMDQLAERHGYTITARFSDDDLSAWDVTVERPGWKAYLKALASGQHDGAASYHLDRLSRNGPDSEALLTVCIDRRLDLVTPGTTLRLGTSPDDQAMFRVWSAMSIHQSSSTSRRERDHKDVARANGRLRNALGGNPPFGFRDGEGDWQTDETHAALLRDVAARMLAGSDLSPAYREACAALDELPLTNLSAKAKGTKRERMPVTEKMVRAALQRPATFGLVTDREGKIMGHAAIDSPPLDSALYDELRVIFEARKRGGLLPADRFPLGPVLVCAKCGNQLAGGQNYYRGTSRAVYMCKNRHRLPGSGYNKPCRGVSANAEQVHAEVAAALTDWAAHSLLYAAAAGAQGQFDDQLAQLDAQLARKRAQLKAIKLEQLRDIQAGDEYAELIEAGNAIVERLLAERATVKAAQSRPAMPEVVVWDELSADRKRELVRMAWGKITVAPGKGGSRPTPMDERLTLIEAA